MQSSMQVVLEVVFLVTIAANSGLTCPEGYGCLRHPKGCGETGASMCDLLVAWKANDANGIDFTARGKNEGTDPRWMAIGFSPDKAMGDDDILMCRQTDSSTVVLEHYWSISTPALNIVDETQTPPSADGLSNIATAFQNGYVSCNFTRAVSVAGKEHIYDLSETTMPDMTPKYYFIFGEGPVVNNVPAQHEVNPFVSSTTVDYMQTGEPMFEVASSEENEEEEEGDDDAAGRLIGPVLLLMLMSFLAIFIKA